jgi:ferredoxin-thioredoxin reductase catalytic subunit
MDKIIIPQQDIDDTYYKLKEDAESGGYFLNPESDFTKDLVRSLLFNEKRYNYRACPCRLSSGIKEDDIDIICPCDYRDPDLNDFSACYCGLYVSKKIAKGEEILRPIPERRPVSKERRTSVEADKKNIDASTLGYPVWRCKVCGYLCARENPPELCPICKATKDRFERFI